ncbi:group III truncated hemoglobin [Niabella ginsengisoli]|uniref:Group III truncated hemoglobin n=1 Tax=Niabella ginsengisoli TaxID=522298 RepID=A0ABS9SN60_9BACT|nr:group III truncated hemoglobin [Niabella ginsengisoli]MCH5599778.1 group III truncated hemoglobin [Niabella ginsengisoli]
MKPSNDIENINDIKLLVNSFYEKIRRHETLGPIFNTVIQDQWPKHLEKMYRFWQTVLLEVHSYFGSPFPPHAKLPVNKKHFDAWLQLWHETLNENFVGTKVEEAKWRSEKMAIMFLSKIEYYQNNKNATPLI